MKNKVKLSIRGHCIETAAKNEFKRYMDSYFSSSDVSKEDEEKIQLLSDFLTTSDFSALRAQDDRLSGEVESDVTIYRDENNNIKIEYINNE